jgi:hypothetical protein
MIDALPDRELPRSVAIVAMGASASSYLWEMGRLGDPREAYDETWTCNGFGGVLKADRVFLMDDLAIQEMRGHSNKYVAGLLMMAENHPGPIYSARAHPDFPGVIPYPLAEVVRATGHAYFTNSVPYMVALAISLGVEKIGLYGCDYEYGQGAVERGRACLEFWCGFAMANGIEVYVPKASNLMQGRDQLYGYWAEQVSVGRDGSVTRSPRQVLPTVAEIEKLMAHAK